MSERSDELHAESVMLPDGDPCRYVLAPLSLSLADGAFGLKDTKNVTVSLTSETTTRVYAALIAGERSSVGYEILLDNDGAKCAIDGLTPKSNAMLGSDARSQASSRELHPAIPISVSPTNDDCASTMKDLARALAIGAVDDASLVTELWVKLESETDERRYVVHFGDSIDNEWVYPITLSNDSASKCLVMAISDH